MPLNQPPLHNHRHGGADYVVLNNLVQADYCVGIPDPWPVYLLYCHLDNASAWLLMMGKTLIKLMDAAAVLRLQRRFKMYGADLSKWLRVAIDEQVWNAVTLTTVVECCRSWTSLLKTGARRGTSRIWRRAAGHPGGMPGARTKCELISANAPCHQEIRNNGILLC